VPGGERAHDAAEHVADTLLGAGGQVTVLHDDWKPTYAFTLAHDDVHMDEGSLIGRDHEIARLGQLLDGLDAAGGAVLVRGDPGIGKTSLIRTAAQRAADRGHRVLATTGIESEANLPFAGLHLLLRPTLDRAETLPPVTA
jgi:hypothetical protein